MTTAARPFAKRGAKLVSMNITRRSRKAILNAVSRGADRSPLFWWMVVEHDAILASARSRIHWKTFCDAAAKHGLTDTKGRPPTERNARETWRQARIAVARERAGAAKLPKRSKPLSRISPDWRPEVVPPAVQPGAMVPAPGGQAGLISARSVSLAALEADPVAKARVDAEMDRVMQQLLDMDHRTFGP